jgi:hypothetical protein
MKDLSLAQLLHDDLEKTVGLTDRLAEQKRAERLAALKEKMHHTNRSLTSLSESLTIATQRCVKFYFWCGPTCTTQASGPNPTAA